jgi:hypothetical protein
MLVKDLTNPAAEIKEVSARGTGNFLDAYSSGEELIVVTMLQHNCEIAEQNITISRVHLANNTGESHVFYNTAYNWIDVSFEASSDGKSTWVEVTYENGERALIQMNTTGPIAKIDIKGTNRFDKFFITENLQLKFFVNKLLITTGTFNK